MDKTYEQINLELGERMYVFDAPDDWFCGTAAQCDNCFGLRVGATEEDVLSFAESQGATVSIYENGKLIQVLKPEDFVMEKE